MTLLATRIQHKENGERLGKVSDERKEGEEKKIQRVGLLFKLYRVLHGCWYKVIYLDLMNIVWIYWKQNEDTFVRLYCCSTRFATTHWSWQGRLIEVGNLENHFGGERFIWGRFLVGATSTLAIPSYKTASTRCCIKMEKGPLLELD